MRLILVTLVTLRELALPLLLCVLFVGLVRRRRRRALQRECALYLEGVLS